MTPSHGRAKAGRPAWTYTEQLCEDTWCSPENLPDAMKDRERWQDKMAWQDDEMRYYYLIFTKRLFLTVIKFDFKSRLIECILWLIENNWSKHYFSKNLCTMCHFYCVIVTYIQKLDNYNIEKFFFLIIHWCFWARTNILVHLPNLNHHRKNYLYTIITDVYLFVFANFYVTAWCKQINLMMSWKCWI